MVKQFNTQGQEVQRTLRDDVPWRYFSGLSWSEEQLLGVTSPKTWKRADGRKKWLEKQLLDVQGERGKLKFEQDERVKNKKIQLQESLHQLVNPGPGDRTWMYIRTPEAELGDSGTGQTLTDAPCKANNFHNIFK